MKHGCIIDQICYAIILKYIIPITNTYYTYRGAVHITICLIELAEFVRKTTGSAGDAGDEGGGRVGRGE